MFFLGYYTTCYDDRDTNGATTIECSDTHALADDGLWQKGVVHNRTNNNDNVIDNITNIMWQDNGESETGNYVMNTLYCTSLDLAGYTDWRLPTANELFSLMNYDGSTNIDAFNNITVATSNENNPNNGYWTSTNNQSDEYIFVTLPQYSYNYDKGFYKKRLCVRNHNEDTTIIHKEFTKENNVVTDYKNNLQWSDNSDTDIDITWIEAINYCNNLELDEKTDWRLANINELSRTVGHNPKRGDSKDSYPNSIHNIFTSTSYLAGVFKILCQHLVIPKIVS